MPIIDVDSSDEEEERTVMITSDEEEERTVRIYQRDELLRLGSNSSILSNFELPSWSSKVLSEHPDLGHIIFPAITETRQEPEPTLPWDKGILDDLKQLGGSLEEQIVHLCERLEISEERESLLISLSHEIEANLRSEFPDCQVFPYGSFSSGFAFENCDLDVYAILGFSVFDESSKKSSKTWSAREKTRAVAEILRRNERFRSATAITNAKIPIVKIKDRRTGTRCDVNTSSVKGVKNSEFLKFCKNYDKRVDQLVKIVKYFAIKHGIISSGVGSHFNSYTVVIMVMFFLQSKDILPSVASFQEDVPEELFENCNFSFNKEKQTSSDNNQDISELLVEFFHFYECFPFSSEVICPRVGRAVKKEHLQSDEMEKKKLQTNKDIVVQDPFELAKNLAQNVSHTRLAQLISAFEFGSRVLSEGHSGTWQLWKMFESDNKI